ncbi:MAG: hypothetical protein WBO10_16740 [Pyrinomonadaceae bacterium]
MVYTLNQTLTVRSNVGRTPYRSTVGRLDQLRRMLYRPKFCANCGDKVERADWPITASRRFCPVCESEFKGQDLIPRVVVGVGILLGVLGLGGYIKSGSPTDSVALKQSKKVADLVSQSQSRVPDRDDKQNAAGTTNQDLRQREATPMVQTPETVASNRPPAKPKNLRAEVSEQAYYCGAETKKGTPCSRRVKGNVRCYQHVGMPTMVGADKLKIN